MGPVDCSGWRHPLHAPAAGACAGGTWQLGGDGGRGMGRCPLCPHGHLNDSQCQRRTCGINLEPMQCRVRGRQSLTEWESDVETGRIPGAKSVWQAQPARSKEQAARSWRHIITMGGLTVGQYRTSGLSQVLSVLYNP